MSTARVSAAWTKALRCSSPGTPKARPKNVHGARQRGMDQGVGMQLFGPAEGTSEKCPRRAKARHGRRLQESAGEQEGRHRPDCRCEADEIGDDELDRPRAGGLRTWHGDRRLRPLGKEKAGDARRFGRGDEYELGAHWIRCGEDGQEGHSPASPSRWHPSFGGHSSRRAGLARGSSALGRQVRGSVGKCFPERACGLYRYRDAASLPEQVSGRSAV
jgi:hypothetical protein